ncbi:MAG: aldo/keto reductase [Defluviitaleaceae bacterium]|nr:aldo/keto reductase [Defluviitaleaceae bacterium]
MATRKLFNGVEIPHIGMGTFGSDRFTAEQVSEGVYGAIKAGYRLIDCAAVYGNEDKIGESLERAFNDGLATRDEMFITSKVWNDMHGKGDVLLSCAKTLRDLKLDYLDMFFVHWPFPNYHAPGCDGDARNPDSRPFDKDEFIGVWRQMEKLVYMGLVRSLGMSNMTVAKLDAVLPLCRIRPVALQMELHPAFQQPVLFDYCVEKSIQPIGFCPIGSPTRPDRDKTEEDISAIEMPEIVAIAEAHEVHPAIVCLKWAIQRGQIPIPFSVVESEYESNLRCIDETPLSDDEMAQIKEADKGCRLIKGQVFLWEGANDWQDLWDEEA